MSREFKRTIFILFCNVINGFMMNSVNQAKLVRLTGFANLKVV